MNPRMVVSIIMLVLVAVTMGALPLPASAAVTVVAWNFDASNTTPSAGSGTITRGSGLVTPSQEYPQGNPTSGLAWSHRDFTANATGAVSDEYIQIQVDLTNYAGIILSFDEQRSGTGPTNYEIYYSTDGNNFISTGATGTTNAAFGTTPMHSHTFPYDSSVDQAIRGQSTVHFRVLAWGATNTSGTWRLDNASITASNRPTAVTLGRFATTSETPLTAVILPVLGVIVAAYLYTRRWKR